MKSHINRDGGLISEVETMPKVTALLTSLQGQQRLLLVFCLIMERSVVLDVLQKGKIKIPLRSGCSDIPCWSVWVLQGYGGGGNQGQNIC